eukprot:4290973-Alexandrium_andersonii.AAC.1
MHAEVQRVKSKRISAWRRRVRGSIAESCRYIRGQASSATAVLEVNGVLVSDYVTMFEALHTAWYPIYNFLGMLHE